MFVHSTKAGRLLIALAVAGLLLVIHNVDIASAHLGDHTPRLTLASAGPYMLSVWTSPSLLRTGEIHVEASVFDRNSRPLQDCLVYVELSPVEGTGAAQTVLAGPAATGAMVEATFDVDEPGRYRVDVLVAGESGATGEAGFEVKVVRIPTAAKASSYLLLITSSLLSVWLVMQFRRVWRPQTKSR